MKAQLAESLTKIKRKDLADKILREQVHGSDPNLRGPHRMNSVVWIYRLPASPWPRVFFFFTFSLLEKILPIVCYAVYSAYCNVAHYLHWQWRYYDHKWLIWEHLQYVMNLNYEIYVGWFVTNGLNNEKVITNCHMGYLNENVCYILSVPINL